MIELPVVPVEQKQRKPDWLRVKLPVGKELEMWNIYSPLWAPVKVEDGTLVLKDKDPFDYAKAERIFPASKKL